MELFQKKKYGVRKCKTQLTWVYREWKDSYDADAANKNLNFNKIYSVEIYQ